ncbi:hypothetical protein UPYG_G00202010 [Umbra pygmaea]|uniref:Galectin n=1 Tax=Umbra pygmaea TaxID=75934 RepID=A0ABD0X8Z8_UMBPY
MWDVDSSDEEDFHMEVEEGDWLPEEEDISLSEGEKTGGDAYRDKVRKAWTSLMERIQDTVPLGHQLGPRAPLAHRLALLDPQLPYRLAVFLAPALAVLTQFHVNLQYGSSTEADIALHINPRFDSHPAYVVTNTKQHSSWGQEERKQPSPFQWGSYFSLIITIQRDAFQLIVNGSPFMTFKHRIPFYAVDTISVGGTVDVSSIAFQNPAPIFPAQPGFQAQVAYPTQAGFPSYPGYGAVPYKSPINGGLCPGRTIHIQGVVNPNATWFSVNLLCNSDVALHYNPRSDGNCVVRNSKLRNQWGDEERDGGMPYRRGHAFTLSIRCGALCYRIWVNGNETSPFKHRHTLLQEINLLEVDGHLSLTSVMI